MTVTPIVLAAGQGKRMHSKQPKVMHPLAGKPLIWHALQAARESSEAAPVVVLGHAADKIEPHLDEDVRIIYQQEQLGTAHAVQQAEGTVAGKTELVLVTNADLPLLRRESLTALIAEQEDNSGPFSLLTVISEDPRGFGRILRSPDGSVEAIIEEAHATPDQLAITELNVGAYCFRADWLWGALAEVPISPKGEYYLTDLVAVAVQRGEVVRALRIEDPAEATGVNTRVHLAEAEAAMRSRINTQWMTSGVTIVDSHTTYIDATVTIGEDTTIWPNTYLQGETSVGADCTIGPNTIARDTRIGSRCSITASMLEHAIVEDDVDIGPFSHLRKGAHLGSHVHLGNYAEVKNSYLASGSKMGHFSYIGDATVGENVNIGAGTITANYDGKAKHRTEIGEDVFIGSDTMLVAPLKIGRGARTGAGSVVTKDVPENTMVVGIPARPIRKLKTSE
jgi:bifunctional UDP-N-acetylglucosamine pyrophosphorylase/glucosamine-1-phosphate N-acetyltransferase